MSITRLGDGASIGIDTLAGLDAGFDPSAYGTVGLHLAADAANGVGVALPSDNADLATWVDLSGNGQSFTQESTYNVPKWRSGVKNGLPALEFDGATSSRRLYRASPTFSVATPVFTVVGQCDATDTAFFSFSNPDSVVYNRSSYWKYYSTGGTVQSSAGSDTAWHVLSGKSGGGSGTIYLDGTSVGTSGFSYDGSSTSARIGMYNTTTYPFDGYIAEIVIWTSITDANRLAAEQALGAKYGITVA